MAAKLGKSTFPAGSGSADFQCFGPPAVKDGEFDSVKICDMGCFTQDGKDSNKFYHAAIVKHRTTNKVYVYFEWGRTGAKSPQFQFVECRDEAEAQREFAAQLHDKNDKRGQWDTIAGIRTLRAKPGKDCYLVRPQAARSTGLPDARSIKFNDAPRIASVTKTPTASPKRNVDQQTLSLLHDLNVATVSYTRGAMADSSIPTQGAIDEARQILTEAMKRVAVVGHEINLQVSDRDLKQLTTMMYGRIPKKKELHSDPKTWILTQDNIGSWQQDLDAFESALKADSSVNEPQSDPFNGMNIVMEWLPQTSVCGKFVYNWFPKMTRNKHHAYGDMKVHNVWKLEHPHVVDSFMGTQAKIVKGVKGKVDRPLFQLDERPDLDAATNKRFNESNTALLAHGSRSVNLPGILRERLRLPKQLVGVVITGAMIGPGAYFADDWKKSAGYTSLDQAIWNRGGNGGVKNRQAFMFLVDVVLGKPYLAPSAHGYTSPPDSHHSVFAKGGHTLGNMGALQNNEWVIYDVVQHNLRYLVEFSAPRR